MPQTPSHSKPWQEQASKHCWPRALNQPQAQTHSGKVRPNCPQPGNKQVCYNIISNVAFTIKSCVPVNRQMRNDNPQFSFQAFHKFPYAYKIYNFFPRTMDLPTHSYQSTPTLFSKNTKQAPIHAFSL